MHANHGYDVCMYVGVSSWIAGMEIMANQLYIMVERSPVKSFSKVHSTYFLFPYSHFFYCITAYIHTYVHISIYIN